MPVRKGAASAAPLAAVPDALVALTADEARRLTDEVKADAARLWTKLLTLYEGEAHTALRFTSWAVLTHEAEFGESKSKGYQMLDAARIDRELEAHSTNGGISLHV